jgi:hypothetical protein
MGNLPRLIAVTTGLIASQVSLAFSPRDDVLLPAVQVLRAIASGSATPAVLEAAIEPCAARFGRAAGCGARLEAVLTAFSKTGLGEKNLVLEAMGKVLQGAEPSRAREEMREARDRIAVGQNDSVEQQGVSGRRLWFSKLAGSERPPVRADEGRISQSVFKARLLVYLNSLLSNEPRLRIRQALEGTTAQSCETLYGGRALDVCSDLGLWRLQWASLWLAVTDLQDSQGDADILSRYLDLDRSILEPAIAKGERSNDESLATYVHVLRRWMERRPTRWQAWADIEELLVPR